MNIQELEWVKRENLPVKIMVMNNEALGMIRHLQRDYFDCLFAGTQTAAVLLPVISQRWQRLTAFPH